MRSITKGNHVHFLKQELSWVRDAVERAAILQELPEAKREYFDALTEYHKAGVVAAKASSDLFAADFRWESPEGYDQYFAPMHDREIAKAEETLRRHLESEAEFLDR